MSPISVILRNGWCCSPPLPAEPTCREEGLVLSPCNFGVGRDHSSALGKAGYVERIENVLLGCVDGSYNNWTGLWLGGAWPGLAQACSPALGAQWDFAGQAGCASCDGHERWPQKVEGRHEIYAQGSAVLLLWDDTMWGVDVMCTPLAHVL